MCWRTAPIGVDMFIVIGMADQPLLICPTCAETVLLLQPTGERIATKEGTPNDEPTLF